MLWLGGAVLTHSLLLALLCHRSVEARKPRPMAVDAEAVAAVLLGRALSDNEVWDELVELSDTIGHRLSGSPQLDQAVAWGAERMRDDGLEVRVQEVMVPRWVRGEERLTLLAPVERDLQLLGLGRSVGTPEGGIDAEVVVVDSFEALEALGDGARGRIVLYDVPFTTYGATVRYRGNGANAAARAGGVAALVRSVTPVSLYTPHTGAMWYDDDVPDKVPAAAITVEDAAWLHRLAEAGTQIRARLQMGAKMQGDVPSANVIGEVKGRERPDEVVVVGCHLDSWDVGQGAQDDGAGCVAAMQAGALIGALPTPPRRTVRVVLFTNEENGLMGGRGYADAHAAERHAALLEMDTGSGPPLGWRIDVRDEDEETKNARLTAVRAALAPVQHLLEPIGATELIDGGSGADIGPTVKGSGALGLGLHQDTSGYWPIHHTKADTIDKIDPLELRRNTAAMAVTTWWLAELPEVL